MSACRYCAQDFGLHLGGCPLADRPPPPGRKPTRYVPPSRAGRIPRDEWLAAVRSSRERKLELARARQARYRNRKRTAA